MSTVMWLDALRGSRSGRRADLAVLAVAAALFGAVFALRLLVDDEPGAALLVLLCLPVTLLGVSFGRAAGLAGAAAAIGAIGVWDLTGGDPGGAVGYGARGAAFVLLGLLPGWFAHRLVLAQRAQGDARAGAQRAQEELEEAQRLAQVGSWHWDAATNRLTWSPQMFRLFGWDPDGAPPSVAAAVSARSHPDDAAAVVAALEQALRDRRPFEIPQQLVLPDGTTRDVLHRGEVVVGAQGTVVAMRGSTQDVTRLLEADRAAQAAAERMAAALGTMIDAVTVGSAVRDDQGRIVDFRLDYANPSAGRLYGVPPEDLVGRRWGELWLGARDERSFGAFVRLVETGEPVELVDQPYLVAGADGPRSGVLDYHAARLGDGYVAAWRDVTSRHRDALALRASTAHFTAAFDHAPVGMVLVGPDRVITRANGAFERMLGYRPEALVGTAFEGLLDPRDVAAAREDFASMIAGERPTYHSERRLVTVDGDVRWVSVSVSRVHGADGVLGVAHVEDIHDRKGLESRLQFLADHDGLTGLFNRRRFGEELSRQLALDARYERTSAVVLLDLENFKYINDTLGHPAGDRLLQVIAGAMHGRLRETDVIGRLGGDEFAVLLPGADERHAMTVTESLLADIRSSEVEHAGRRVRSTGSAGIARLDGGAGPAEADDALANADLAMYAAKEAGRNTYVVYDPHGPHAARSHARFHWLDRVRNALDDELFTLQAQPILDLATDRVAGCELLLRMRDDARLIDPEVFLSIAERHGLANAIDRFVIRHAIRLAAEHERPAGFRWEINLSADSLGDPEIPRLIESTLAETGVPAASLVFEITETAAITNMDHAQAFANRITDIGCRFALDDFGAGYGSFYYLKHLPFEYLKIDGEFIRQLTTSNTDRVIVQAIVTAARQLGKQTVAEYVGDAETLELLRSFGVDHAQGFHIGHPVDPGAPLPPCLSR